MAPAQEVISPELVLIDPELAARVRASGPVTDCLALRPRPAPAPAHPSARTGTRLRNGLLVISLLANALFLASAWSGGQQTPSPAPPPAVGLGLGTTGTGGKIGTAASSGACAPTGRPRPAASGPTATPTACRSTSAGAVFVPQTPP